jgi:hypothetical protein
MNANFAETKKVNFILARLRLAQSILEESDYMEGRSGYDFKRPDWWYRPRHEREALVTYLLLTCFDYLGQEKGFTTFADWLKSKKPPHILERQTSLDSLQPDATHLEAASALMDQYQSLYGVRNAFYQGINNLTEESKQQLFLSVRLMFIPEFDPNVSKCGLPLEDEKLERDLKLRHLHERRNRFTHRLEQLVSLSTPSMSESGIQNGSSWSAQIRDSKLTYFGVHYETVLLKTGGAYYYELTEWPFVLLEVLYAAIGVALERTSIRLKFKVLFYSSAEPGAVVTLDAVEHGLLKDVHSLEKYAWTKYATPTSTGLSP